MTSGETVIGTAGMPANAGTLTYAKGTEGKTGSVTVTSWDVDSTGKVTYTLSGGVTGDTVTLPVIIKSTNYADATVKVVITLTAKDDQAALTLTGGTTVVYGQTLQLGTSGGSGTGAVTYAVTNGTGEATIDAASGKLDSLANDDSLTDDQKKQVKELQKQLSDAQQQEKQQEENSQKKAEQRDAFSKKMDELESDDLKISSAENQEDELAMTASSFEQWDNLLSEMYDYLATVLNADQYASEEASYKQWVQERDSGAENAAKETEDDTAKQLASYSFKQSYTKTHCYKLLDLMN